LFFAVVAAEGAASVRCVVSYQAALNHQELPITRINCSSHFMLVMAHHRHHHHQQQQQQHYSSSSSSIIAAAAAAL
jgi:hypothetical protein